jgi:hypothetical protein
MRKRSKRKAPPVATYETQDGRTLPTVPPKPRRQRGTHVVQVYVSQPYIGDGGYVWTTMSTAVDEITARRWAREKRYRGQEARVVTMRQLNAQRRHRDTKLGRS